MDPPVGGPQADPTSGAQDLSGSGTGVRIEQGRSWSMPSPYPSPCRAEGTAIGAQDSAAKVADRNVRPTTRSGPVAERIALGKWSAIVRQRKGIEAAELIGEGHGEGAKRRVCGGGASG